MYIMFNAVSQNIEHGKYYPINQPSLSKLHSCTATIKVKCIGYNNDDYNSMLNHQKLILLEKLVVLRKRLRVTAGNTVRMYYLRIYIILDRLVVAVSVEALVFIVNGRSCSEGCGFDSHCRPGIF